MSDLHVGLGFSKNKNSFKAGQEAAAKAFKQINNCGKLVIVFASIKFNHQRMLKGIRSITKNIPLIGCSSTAEIINGTILNDSVCVMVLNSPRMKVGLSLGKNTNRNETKAGLTAANMAFNNLGHNVIVSRPIIKENKHWKSCMPYFTLMFADSIHSNSAAIIRAVSSILGPGFPIVGGCAGDNFKFKKTYQFYNDQVLENSVVLACIYSDLKVGYGVGNGWYALKHSYQVTKAKGTTVYELNHKPILDVYKDIFGKKAEDPKFSIGKYLGFKSYGEKEYRLRGPLNINKKEKSITFAAEVPQNSTITLMDGDLQSALAAAKSAAEEAVKTAGTKDIGCAFLFDCAARYLLFGDKYRKSEINAVKEVIGKNVPIIGFYTYGEFSPVLGSHGTHNATLVILVISKNSIKGGYGLFLRAIQNIMGGNI